MVALTLLIVGVFGAIVRPRGIRAWLLPVSAALVALVVRVLDVSEVRAALRPLWALP